MKNVNDDVYMKKVIDPVFRPIIDDIVKTMPLDLRTFLRRYVRGKKYVVIDYRTEYYAKVLTPIFDALIQSCLEDRPSQPLEWLTRRVEDSDLPWGRFEGHGLFDFEQDESDGPRRQSVTYSTFIEPQNPINNRPSVATVLDGFCQKQPAPLNRALAAQQRGGTVGTLQKSSSSSSSSFRLSPESRPSVATVLDGFYEKLDPYLLAGTLAQQRGGGTHLPSSSCPIPSFPRRSARPSLSPSLSPPLCHIPEEASNEDEYNTLNHGQNSEQNRIVSPSVNFSQFRRNKSSPHMHPQPNGPPQQQQIATIKQSEIESSPSYVPVEPGYVTNEARKIEKKVTNVSKSDNIYTGASSSSNYTKYGPSPHVSGIHESTPSESTRSYSRSTPTVVPTYWNNNRNGIGATMQGGNTADRSKALYSEGSRGGYSDESHDHTHTQDIHPIQSNHTQNHNPTGSRHLASFIDVDQAQMDDQAQFLELEADIKSVNYGPMLSLSSSVTSEVEKKSSSSFARTRSCREGDEQHACREREREHSQSSVTSSTQRAGLHKNENGHGRVLREVDNNNNNNNNSNNEGVNANVRCAAAANPPPSREGDDHNAREREHDVPRSLYSSTTQGAKNNKDNKDNKDRDNNEGILETNRRRDPSCVSGAGAGTYFEVPSSTTTYPDSRRDMKRNDPSYVSGEYVSGRYFEVPRTCTVDSNARPARESKRAINMENQRVMNDDSPDNERICDDVDVDKEVKNAEGEVHLVRRSKCDNGGERRTQSSTGRMRTQSDGVILTVRPGVATPLRRPCSGFEEQRSMGSNKSSTGSRKNEEQRRNGSTGSRNEGQRRNGSTGSRKNEEQRRNDSTGSRNEGQRRNGSTGSKNDERRRNDGSTVSKHQHRGQGNFIMSPLQIIPHHGHSNSNATPSTQSEQYPIKSNAIPQQKQGVVMDLPLRKMSRESDSDATVRIKRDEWVDVFPAEAEGEVEGWDKENKGCEYRDYNIQSSCGKKEDYNIMVNEHLTCKNEYQHPSCYEDDTLCQALHEYEEYDYDDYGNYDDNYDDFIYPLPRDTGSSLVFPTSEYPCEDVSPARRTEMMYGPSSGMGVVESMVSNRDVCGTSASDANGKKSTSRSVMSADLDANGTSADVGKTNSSAHESSSSKTDNSGKCKSSSKSASQVGSMVEEAGRDERWCAHKDGSEDGVEGYTHTMQGGSLNRTARAGRGGRERREGDENVYTDDEGERTRSDPRRNEDNSDQSIGRRYNQHSLYSINSDDSDASSYTAASQAIPQPKQQPIGPIGVLNPTGEQFWVAPSPDEWRQSAGREASNQPNNVPTPLRSGRSRLYSKDRSNATSGTRASRGAFMPRSVPKAQTQAKGGASAEEDAEK